MCWETAASEMPSLLAMAPEQMSWFSRIVTIENLVSSERALRMSVMSLMVSLFKQTLKQNRGIYGFAKAILGFRGPWPCTAGRTRTPGTCSSP